MNLNNFSFKGNDKTYEVFTLNSGDDIKYVSLITGLSIDEISQIKTDN